LIVRCNVICVFKYFTFVFVKLFAAASNIVLAALLSLTDFWDLGKFVFLVPLEAQHVVMVLPESVSVGNCDQGDSHTLHVGVELAFYIDRDG